MFLVFILCLFTKVNAQDISDMSRAQKVILLHRLDSLIYDYEFYSNIMEGAQFTEYKVNQFKRLFTGNSIQLFDDATPNYKNGDENIIWEEEKDLSTYIGDIKSFYDRIYINLKRAYLGNPLKRGFIKDGYINVPVEIEKEFYGYTTEKGDFETHSLLIIWTKVPLTDFLNQNPQIEKIEKKNINGCKWIYNPPFQKIPRLKKLLFFKRSFTNISLSNQNTSSLLLGVNQADKMSLSLTGVLRYNMVDKENDAFGISFGIGSSLCKSIYSIGSYENVLLAVDKDDDTYFEIVEGKNISEDWDLITLDIPAHINYDHWFGKVGIYLSAGVTGSYFLKNSYNSSGTFTYKGYYPQYNIVLSDIEEYQFISEVNKTTTGDLNLLPYYFSMDLSTGFSFKFEKAKLMLFAGFSLQNSISNLLDALDEKQYITTSGGEFGSAMNELKYGYMDSYGFHIGLRKYIKRIRKDKVVKRIGTY